MTVYINGRAFEIAPYSFIVEKVGSLYVAKSKIRDGSDVVSTDLTTCVQGAIDQLPIVNAREGTIRFKTADYHMAAGDGLLLGKATVLSFENFCRIYVDGNLTALGGDYTDPAVFTIDSTNMDYRTGWGIVSDGWLYVQQSNNEAGSIRYNGHGVYAEHAAEAGFRCQENMRGLWFQNTKEGYASFKLENAMKLNMDRIKIRTYGDGMHFTTDGGISAYGNSQLDEIVIGMSLAGARGIFIEGIDVGTTRALNLTKFGRVQVGGVGTALANQKGIYIKDDGWIRFDMLNVEGGMQGVHLEDAIHVDFGSVFGRVTTDGAKLFDLTGITKSIHVDSLFGDYPGAGGYVWHDQVTAYQFYRRNIIRNMEVQSGTVDQGRNTVIDPAGCTTVTFNIEPKIWSNMPAVKTELFGTADRRISVPIKSMHSARLIANVTTAGTAGAILYAEFSDDLAAWSALMTGTRNPQIVLTSTGYKMSDWDDASVYAFASGVKDENENIYIRIVGYDGDGADDPEVGLVALQFRG